jgi:RND family efflux transporter MFP subunit
MIAEKLGTSGPKEKKIIFRIIICLLVLFLGIVGMKALGSLKKPPAEAVTPESQVKVEVMKAEKKDHPIFINGYGEVNALNVVTIAPEISGKITMVHPRLEAGEVINKGETLFEIDSKDYVTAVNAGKKRLKFLERTKELAKKDYQRIELLFRKNNVGTESGVDLAEKAMLSADDLFTQVEQALTLAEINLERCKVSAQFNGRVSYVALEKGQFVAPGQHVLTLVDDSILEINVPIDSRFASKWLQFEGNRFKENKTFFSDIVRVPCTISWTEGDTGHSWNGFLHRIVKFDKKTRTLTAAVRIDPVKIAEDMTDEFPLVEGMFCSVRIPGKVLTNIIRLPRQAVSYNNTVYTSVDNRLKTIPVEVDYIEGGYAYISSGLHQGDIVVTTRLIDPLENALLKIVETKNGDNDS